MRPGEWEEGRSQNLLHILPRNTHFSLITDIKVGTGGRVITKRCKQRRFGSKVSLQAVRRVRVRVREAMVKTNSEDKIRGPDERSE